MQSNNMGKLFKTISLEERLKESVHNTLPNLPKGSDQGVTQLQAKKIIPKPKISSLKITPQSADRSSDILKSTLRSKGAKPTATIQPFIPTDLTKFIAPLSNTKFRSSINLSNRLTQPFLGTTAHLAQYFLSDVNTNYIKIKPFTVFDHTSNVTVSPFITKPLQGSTDPITLPSTILTQGEVTLIKPKEALQEGLILVNGALKSTTNITIAAQDVLQKAFIFKNGVYTSTTKLSNPLQEVTQGEGTNPTISTSTPFIEKLQGIALVNNKVVSLTVVSKATANVKQGEVQIANRQSNPVTNINEIVVPFTSHIRHLMSPVDINDGPGVVSWGNNKITGLKKSIRTEVALLDHQKVNAPQVNTFFDPLAFSFNKEFATFYHGDIDRLKNYYPQDNSTWSITARAVAPILVSGSITGGPPSINVNLGDYLKTATTWDYSKIPANGIPEYYGNTTGLPKYEGVKFIKNVGNTVALENPSNEVLAKMATVQGDTTTANNLISYITSKTSGPIVKGVTTALAYISSGSKNIGLSEYKTKTYEEIANAAKSGSAIPNKNKFTPPTVYNLKRVEGMYSTDPTARTQVGIKGKNDFVKIRFASGDNRDAPGHAWNFTGYITAITDGLTQTLTDVSALSTFQASAVYAGVGRSGGLTFKMAAMNPTELTSMYAYLNNFIRLTALPVNTTDTAKKAKRPPGVYITVGGWWKKQKILMESIKVDVDMADGSWDIEKELPQVITVSITMRFIDRLNSNINFIGYNDSAATINSIADPKE